MPFAKASKGVYVDSERGWTFRWKQNWSFGSVDFQLEQHDILMYFARVRRLGRKRPLSDGEPFEEVTWKVEIISSPEKADLQAGRALLIEGLLAFGYADAEPAKHVVLVD